MPESIGLDGLSEPSADCVLTRMHVVSEFLSVYLNVGVFNRYAALSTVCVYATPTVGTANVEVVGILRESMFPRILLRCILAPAGNAFGPGQPARSQRVALDLHMSISKVWGTTASAW